MIFSFIFRCIIKIIFIYAREMNSIIYYFIINNKYINIYIPYSKNKINNFII